jgi:hypothetical protein
MSGSEGVVGSDLPRVDAAVVSADDLLEIPELTDDWFNRAVVHQAGVPVGPRRAVNPRPDAGTMA